MSFQARMCLPALTAVVVAAASAPTVADTGFYVGATAGGSIFRRNKSDLDAAVVDAWNAVGANGPSPFASSTVINSSSLKKSDVAFGALLGYRLTPAFSIEAAYIDLGQLKYNSNDTVMQPFGNGIYPFAASAFITTKAHGPTLTALGILPLSPAWEIYGRAGLFFSSVTLQAGVGLDLPLLQLAGFGTKAGSFESVSANSVDPVVGVGAAWHVADHVALRAEYTRFINVGDKDKTGEINIDLLNVGLTYSFH
jgi:opacity protein-like surface antigen